MLNDIKKSFFAFRNGIIADTLRKAGMPYKVIFGLQIPQIAEIARSQSPSLSIAEQLWNDRDVRESRILATYLFPLDKINMEKAMELARDVQTQEEADMLAFRLLKRLTFADTLLSAMEDDPEIPQSSKTALQNHLS